MKIAFITVALLASATAFAAPLGQLDPDAAAAVAGVSDVAARGTALALAIPSVAPTAEHRTGCAAGVGAFGGEIGVGGACGHVFTAGHVVTTGSIGVGASGGETGVKASVGWMF